MSKRRPLATHLPQTQRKAFYSTIASHKPYLTSQERQLGAGRGKLDFYEKVLNEQDMEGKSVQANPSPVA